MAQLSTFRVKREFKEIMTSEEAKDSLIKVELIDESDYTRLQGKIVGPPGTPFHGGTFLLEITIPDSYPFNPPKKTRASGRNVGKVFNPVVKLVLENQPFLKVKFLTRIWHPNISSVTGAICLDILKDQWAAAMTLRTVLLSIQLLLSAAEPDDPQDAVVAKQYKESRSLYKLTARHWAQVYAGAPRTSDDEAELQEKVVKLVMMGFEEDQSRAALSSHDWNVQSAVDYLCS